MNIGPTAVHGSALRIVLALALLGLTLGVGSIVAVDIATSDNPDDYEALLNLLGVIAMVMVPNWGVFTNRLGVP